MLFCLKPSEQVQYLQISFEDRQGIALCFQRGALGAKGTLAFATEPSASIPTLQVVSRREDTGTWH